MYKDFLNKLTAIYLSYLENDSIERNVPKQWSYMHLFSSIQLSRLLSKKYILDEKLAVLCVAFHDIATIVKGITEKHAIVGSDMFYDFLNENFENNNDYLTEIEKDIIKNAIRKHSDKHLIDENEYVEFTKDVDCYDRYLYGIDTPEEYMNRVKKIDTLLEL